MTRDQAQAQIENGFSVTQGCLTFHMDAAGCLVAQFEDETDGPEYPMPLGFELPPGEYE